jgi:hypothetical protein
MVEVAMLRALLPIALVFALGGGCYSGADHSVRGPATPTLVRIAPDVQTIAAQRVPEGIRGITRPWAYAHYHQIDWDEPVTAFSQSRTHGVPNYRSGRLLGSNDPRRAVGFN